MDRPLDVTPWLTDAEQEAWSGLQQMQGMLSGRLNRELSESSGLSLQDYAVLVNLSEHADERLLANELGRRLGWEKSRLSHHVARMAARGLVARERCPLDHRGLYVTLTASGRAALESAAPGHCASVRRWFVDRLEAEQLATVAAVARRVTDGLREVCETEETLKHTAGQRQAALG
jgi:DNA-binding MarR family transcriptional regulator